MLRWWRRWRGTGLFGSDMVGFAWGAGDRPGRERRRLRRMMSLQWCRRRCILAARRGCRNPTPLRTRSNARPSMSFVLALDQGTTSSRALVFDHEGAVRAVAQAGIPADSFRTRDGSSTTPTKSGRRNPVCCTRRSRGPASARGHRGHRHHEPARDDRGVGPRDRPADRARPSCGRTGAPRRNATRCAPPATRR